MLKNKLFIVILAVLFIVVLVYNLLFFRNLSIEKEDTVKSKNQTSILTQEKADEPLSQGKDFSRDLGRRGWGRNPFLTPEEIASLRQGKIRPRSGPPEELPHWEVNTILVSDSRRIAILGNPTVTVTVGEWIGEEKVLEINPDNVVLGRSGIRRVIKLKESSVPLVVKEGK